MRARNVKPGFFVDSDLSEVDFASRLLFIGLWCYADREGRFEWKPKQIKASIFPYDKVDIEKLLCNLMSLHVITCHDGIGYVENFRKHQHPHPHEAKSTLPEKGELNQCHDMSCNVTKCQEDVRIEDVRIEDSNNKPLPFQKTADYENTFDWFWTKYTSQNERGRGGNKKLSKERFSKTINSSDDALAFCFSLLEYFRQVDEENEGRPEDKQRALKLPEVFMNCWQGYKPEDLDQKIADHKAAKENG